MVLEDVQAVLFAAGRTHARADDFRQAVNVIGFDVRLGFDAFAHFLCPGFRAENTGLERQRPQVNAHLRRTLKYAQEITGGTAQGGRAKILHQHDLPVRIAARDRDDRGAQRLRTVMRAQTAGEQTITISILNNVAPLKTAGRESADHHACPHAQVFLGIGDYNRLAGGAAGRVQPHHFAHWTGEQTEGIGVAQVRFHGVGKQRDIRKGFDVFRRDAALVHATAKERNLFIGASHHYLEAMQLQIAQLFYR